MGSSDEQKDRLSSHDTPRAGGKDLLYGGLVGRAAADSGLAQALAASETQRNDQLKRLEENLIA